MDKLLSIRWGFLCLGISASLAQGVAYSSSVIRDPLLLQVGIANQPEVLKAHWATVFTLCITFVPLGMIVAGWLTHKQSLRLPLALGAIFFASGLFLASFATSYLFLCFTFGFMLSIGNGLSYGPLVASAVQWFPDRRGLASGLLVGAMGFGPVLIAPFCGIMLDYGFSIQTILQCLGAFALIVMGSATLITSPPSNFQGAVKSGTPKPDAPQKSARQITSRNIAWQGMVVTADFWILSLFFFLATMPGIMLISQALSIFILLGGFEAVTAAMLVAVLAVANAAGRILMGTIGDYLGRVETLIIIFLCTAVAMFTLPFATNPILLVSVIIVIGITYGGSLGLFPSLCADSFGLKNMSLNYAILFIAFALSAVVGPQIYSLMTNPQYAFFLTASFALLGGIGAVICRKRFQ